MSATPGSFSPGEMMFAQDDAIIGPSAMTAAVVSHNAMTADVVTTGSTMTVTVA